jgi:SEC-C motif
MGTAKVGRNQWCPCGSGKKFKHCHGAQADGMSLAMKLALVAAGAALVAGLVLGFSSFNTEATPGGVWSEEHNHFH